MSCRALHDLLQQIPLEWRACTAAIAVAGTTTTSILIDRHDGRVLADPILYNQPQSQQVVSAAEVIQPFCYLWTKGYRNNCSLWALHLSTCGDDSMALLQAFVPADHSAGASVSSLCKLLFWHQQGILQQVHLSFLCMAVLIDVDMQIPEACLPEGHAYEGLSSCHCIVPMTYSGTQT